jgi:transposase-like protein
MGRVRVSRARREALLDEFERSGGSGAQFAAYVGVKYSTFAYWVSQRRRRKALGLGKRDPDAPPKGNGAETLRWWETVVEPPAKGAPESEVLRVQLPGGARLDIATAAQAALAAVLLEKLGQLGAKPC